MAILAASVNALCPRIRSIRSTVLICLCLVGTVYGPGHASDTVRLAPREQSVVLGHEFAVDIRLAIEDKAVVVSDLKIGFSSGLAFVRYERAMSDHRFFVDPAFSVDLEQRIVNLVEGQPNPGHLDQRVAGTRLWFRAETLGRQSVWVRFEQGSAEDSNLLEIGNPPVDGLSDVSDMTIDVVEERSQRWAFPAVSDGSIYAIVAGPQGANFSARLLSSDGDVHADLGDFQLEPHAKASLALPASGAGAWLQLEGRGVRGGYGVEEDGDRLMALPLVGATQEIYVPHVARSLDQFFTHAFVAQDQDHERPVRLGFNGGELGLDLSAVSSVKLDFNATYPNGIPGGLDWGVVHNDRYDAALFGSEIFGKTQQRQKVGLGLDDQVGSRLFYTHVAKNLSVFWTGIVISNVTDVPGEVQLLAHRSDGSTQQLAFPIAGSQKVTILYQSDGTGLPTTITSPDLGLSLPAETEWLEITSDRALTGYALFGDRADRYLAGFQSAKKAVSSLCFPYVANGADQWTGFAMVNTSNEATAVEVLVLDSGGGILRRIEHSLQRKQKLLALDSAFFDGDPLPQNASHVVIQQLQGDPALAGFTLHGDLGDRKKLAGLAALQ